MPQTILVTYLKRYFLYGASVYALIVLMGSVLRLPQTTVFTSHELFYHHFPQIALFSFCWIVVMLSMYFVLSRQVKTNFREIFLHMGVIAMLGPVCEVAINNICRFIFGSPLWVYHFFPVHNHDTSLYSFFVWAMYGCHLYFVDRAFIQYSTQFRTILFALILSIDAIVLEFTLNLSSIYTLHTFIFFYMPNDVQHLTTLAVVPFYFLGGVLAAEAIQRSLKWPVLIGSLCLLAGFSFTFFA